MQLSGRVARQGLWCGTQSFTQQTAQAVQGELIAGWGAGVCRPGRVSVYGYSVNCGGGDMMFAGGGITGVGSV